MSKSAPNFGALLDKPSAEVEKPKPMPQGTYVFVVHGLPRFDKSSKKQTEFVEFTCNYLEAGDDVDQDALKEAGGFAGKSTKATFYITEDALWRLKEFLDSCGVEEGDLTLRQRIEETTGKQFVGSIRHEASQDGQNVFARLGTTAPLEG